MGSEVAQKPEQLKNTPEKAKPSHFSQLSTEIDALKLEGPKKLKAKLKAIKGSKKSQDISKRCHIKMAIGGAVIKDNTITLKNIKALREISDDGKVDISNVLTHDINKLVIGDQELTRLNDGKFYTLVNGEKVPFELSGDASELEMTIPKDKIPTMSHEELLELITTTEKLGVKSDALEARSRMFDSVGSELLPGSYSGGSRGGGGGLSGPSVGGGVGFNRPGLNPRNPANREEYKKLDKLGNASDDFMDLAVERYGKNVRKRRNDVEKFNSDGKERLKAVLQPYIERSRKAGWNEKMPLVVVCGLTAYYIIPEKGEKEIDLENNKFNAYQFPVSMGKNGYGTTKESYKSPEGAHYVDGAKIDSRPINASIAGDFMLMNGAEASNANSASRGIAMHGTKAPWEQFLGEEARSLGCTRTPLPALAGITTGAIQYGRVYVYVARESVAEKLTGATA
jgi:L,D-transpeptidase-like protein